MVNTITWKNHSKFLQIYFSLIYNANYHVRVQICPTKLSFYKLKFKTFIPWLTRLLA